MLGNQTLAPAPSYSPVSSAGKRSGPSIMGILGGSLPFVGSAIQSFINARQQRMNIDRSNQANRELAQYQYQKDVEMWNKANAYNAPEAQMQRLKNAGLNPNLVYGSGAPGNTSAQLPKYNAPTQRFDYESPVNPMAMLSAYQDMRLKQAQIDNVEKMNKIREIQYDDLHKQFEWDWFQRAGVDYGGKKVADPFMGRKIAQVVKENNLKTLAKHNADIAEWNLEQKRKTGQHLLDAILLENYGRGLENTLKEKGLNWYTFRNIMNSITGILGGIARFK